MMHMIPVWAGVLLFIGGMIAGALIMILMEYDKREE